tara:strand:+ start:37875 stop:47864 length:9990 start_codon:yes stop_codon:yes gene_type:complete
MVDQTDPSSTPIMEENTTAASLTKEKQKTVRENFNEKAKAAANIQLQKKLELDRESTIRSIYVDPDKTDEADFILNGNPALTVAERRYILANSKRKKAQNQLSETIRLQDTARSVGEMAGDTAISLGKGAVNLAGGFYGLANVLSQGLNATVGTAGRTIGSLLEDGSIFDEEGNLEAGLFNTAGIDTALNLSKDFVDTQDILSGFQSEGLRNTRDAVNLRVREARQQRLTELKEQGIDPTELANQLKVEGTGFTETLGAMWDNPQLIVDGLLETGPEFLGGGLVKKSADTFLTGLKKLIKKDGSGVAEKAAEGISDATAGTINIVAGEAGNTANQAAASVLRMSDEDVMESKAAEELLKENPDYTPEQIKRILADQASMTAFAIAGPLSVLTGKVTGAAKLEGSVLQRLSGQKGNIADKTAGVLGQTVSEGSEELVQGVTGAVAENVAVGEALDKKDYNPVEGAGEQAAAGLVIGSALGGSLGTVQKTVEAIKDGSTIAGGAAETVQDSKDIQAGNYEEVIKRAAENDQPDRALAALTDGRVLQKVRNKSQEDPDAVITHGKAISKQYNRSIAMLQELHKAELEAKDNKDTKAVKRIQRRKQQIEQTLVKYKNKEIKVIDYLIGNKAQSAEAKATIDKLSSTEQEVELSDDEINNAIKYFGSDPSAVDTESLAKFETVSERLNPAQKQRLSDIKTVKQAENSLAEVAGKKSIDEVNSEVLTGKSKQFVGLRTHQSAVNNALKIQDKETADEAVGNMRSFVEQRIRKANLAKRIFDGIKNNNPEVSTLQEKFKEEFSYGSANDKGAFIDQRSGKLVRTLGAEAELAKAYFNNVQGAYQSTFNEEVEAPKYDVNLPSQDSLVPDVETDIPEAEVTTENLETEVETDLTPETAESVDTPKQDVEPVTQETEVPQEDTEKAPSMAQEVLQELETTETKEQLKNRTDTYVERVFSERVLKRGTRIKTKELSKIRKDIGDTLKNVIDQRDDITPTQVKEAVDTVAQGYTDRAEDNVDTNNKSGLYRYGVKLAEKANAKFSLQTRLMEASRNLNSLFRIKPGPKGFLSSRLNPIDWLVSRKELSQLPTGDSNFLIAMKEYRDVFQEAINKPEVFGNYFRKAKDSKDNPITWLQTRTKRQTNNFTSTGLEQNVVDAMFVAGMEAIGRTLNKHENSEDDIRGIVGDNNTNADDSITAAQYKNFAYIGINKATIIDQIGNNVLNLLGLQEKQYIDQDVIDENGNITGKERIYLDPTNQERLAVALGNFVLSGLASTGAIEITLYPNEVIEKAKLKENKLSIPQLLEARFKEKQTDYTEVAFVKPVSTGTSSSDLHPMIRKITGAFSNMSPNFFDETFGLDSEPKEPSLEPIKLKQTNYKKTLQKIPARVKKILQRHSERPIQTKEGISALVSNLFDVTFDSSITLGTKEDDMIRNKLRIGLFGFTDLDTMPADLVHHKKAKNDSILRDITLNVDWMNSVKDKVFYVPHELWRNSRFGIASAVANMQNSKLARHMFSYSDQRVEIDLINGDEETNLGFRLALAQHLGIKIDKNTIDTSLEQLEELENDPTILEGLQVLSEIEQGEVTADTANKLLAAIEKAGNENFQSLEGLINLKRYLEAKDNGKPFTTDIGIEVDGVNNGVAISLIQFGADNPDTTKMMLEATGVYMDGKFTNFSEWRNAGEETKQDLYEMFSEQWGKLVEADANRLGEASLLPYWKVLIGDMLDNRGLVTKLGRDLAKPIVMTGNYLAGYSSQFSSFSDEVYEKMLIKLVNTESQDFIGTFVNLMERLEEPLNAKQLKTLAENPKKLSLSPKQAGKLYRSLATVYFGPMKDASEISFGTIRKRMQDFAFSYQVGFETWFAFYEKAQEAKRNELGIDKGKPLPKDVEAELYESTIQYAPVMPSYFSGDMTEALEMYKTARDRLTSKDTRVILKFGEGNQNIRSIRPLASAEAGKVIDGIPYNFNKSVSDQPSYRKFTNPGVAPGARAVQSLDGTTMLLFLEKIGALNIHDAVMLPVDKAFSSTKAMNEAFLEAMDYSLPMAGGTMLNKAFTVIRKAKTRLDPNQSNLAVIAKRLGVKPTKKKTAEQVLYAKIFNAGRNLNVANASRKEVLSRISSLGQYHLPNGELYVQEKPTGGPEIDLNTLGSEDSVFSDFNPTTVDTITPTNSGALFGKLAQLDGDALPESHYEQLSSVLDIVVNRVIDPLKVRIQNMSPRAVGRFQADSKTVDLKLTGSNANQGNKSNAEVYVHELVHAVTEEGFRNKPRARAEVKKVFTAVRNAGMRLYPDNPELLLLSNPLAASDVQRRNAKEVWDYVMDNNQGTYLDEFIAHGLTNELMLTALKNPEVDKELSKIRRTFNLTTKSDATFTRVVVGALDMVLNIFSDLLNVFADKYFKTTDMKADARVFALAQYLGEKEAEHTSKFWKAIEKVEGFNAVSNKQVREWIIEPLIKYAEKSKISQIKQLSTIIGSVVTDRVTPEGFSATVKMVMNRTSISKDNLAASLMRELQGQKKDNRGLYKLLRLSGKHVDQARKHTSNAVKSVARGYFKVAPTRDQSEAITRIGFKTDLSSLLLDDMALRNMTPEQVDEYLSNPANQNSFKRNAELIKDLVGSGDVRAREIKKLEDSIRNEFGANAQYYIMQARSLGSLMANGIPLLEDSLRNAHAIANLAGRSSMQPVGDLAIAELLIDQLATLHGLDNSSDTDLRNFYEIFSEEASQPDNDIVNNGVIKTLQMYAQFKRESLDTLFEGNPMLTTKGYIKEITNPNIGLAFAQTQEERKALEKQGYQFIKTVGKDSSDFNQRKTHIYRSKVAGMNTYNKAILSITGMRKSGTTLYDGHVISNTGDPSLASIVDVKRVRRINENRYKNNQYGLQEGVLLQPVLNPAGDIVDYRYVMAEATRRQLLDRNDDFGEVIGGMYGNMVDKRNSVEINNSAIKYLKDFYDNADDLDTEWVELSPTSDDKDAREFWNMLPESTRQYAKEVWNNKPVMIRKEDYRLVTGFRKWSISSIDTERMRKSQNQMMRLAGEYITKAVNRPGVRITENVIQELVRMAKDTIVVKSGGVLLANILSNAVVLRTEGIPVSKLIKYQAEGWKYAAEYKKMDQELSQLQIELASDPRMGRTKKKRKEARIAQLGKEMQLSPVRDLIDEGMFQTIVEDIELETESFTYKSQLEQWVSPITDKVPQSLKDIGNTLFMTHDTKLYRALLDATQLSDFVARYALHKHQLENGMEYNESVTRIVDTFVDYDSPTHVSIQYLNDMGVLMFTKFFIRIQKVILRQIRENPGNVLSFVLMQQLLGIDAPDIFETIALDPGNLGNRLYSPFGALEDVMQLHLLNVSP